ncbi:MAG: lysostaphin resistance A-like protein [Verrucomicrobiales bacterium]
MTKPSWRLFLSGTAFELSLAVLGLIGIGLLVREPSAWSGGMLHDLVWGLLFSIPLFLLAAGYLRLYKKDAHRVWTTFEQTGALSCFRKMPGWQVILVAVSAGLGEEIFFRGFLQVWLSPWLSTWGAVVIVSIGFACLHPITRLYVILAFVASLWFGWMLAAGYTLLVAIISHAFYDAVMLLLLQARLRLKPE